MGGKRPDRAMDIITRLYANTKPYAVANVAGTLRAVATLMSILNIKLKPGLRGVRDRATTPPSLPVGKDTVTHATNIAVMKRVRTHAMEPLGIVTDGCVRC